MDLYSLALPGNIVVTQISDTSRGKCYPALRLEIITMAETILLSLSYLILFISESVRTRLDASLREPRMTIIVSLPFQFGMNTGRISELGLHAAVLKVIQASPRP